MAVLLLALWIANHPYYGVIHDSRVYLIQALGSLYPGRLSQDLFLKYGSQDAFSVFTPLYSRVVAVLGPARAAFAATVAGEALWLSAVVFLTRSLFAKTPEFLFAAVGAIAFDTEYVGRILIYAEPFATSRLFAEGLVLLALALAFRGRRVSCVAVLLAAAAVHPLMAAAGIGVLALMAAFADRRVWILIGVAAVAGAALVALRVGPFSRALVRMDDAWFRIVLKREAYVFLSRWEWRDFWRLAATLSVLGAAWALGTPRERRLVAAVAIVTVGAMTVFFLGADVARNVLVINLQLWRVLWLTTVFANMFLAVVTLRTPAAWVSKSLLLAACAASITCNFFLAADQEVPSLILIACATLAVELHQQSRVSRLLGLAARAATAVALATMLGVIATHMQDWHELWTTLLRAAIAFGAVALIALWLRGQFRWLLAPAGAALLACGVAMADERAPWGNFVQSDDASAGLGAFMAGAGNTYWEGIPGLELLWFKLRVPSYYSCIQGSGVMFYRATALEYARRGEALRPLDTEDFDDKPGSLCLVKNHAKVHGPTTRAQLAGACRALPDLDTLVLAEAVPGAASRVWRSPVPAAYTAMDGKTRRATLFYRYSCAALR
jgi:hypothetical protein